MMIVVILNLILLGDWSEASLDLTERKKVQRISSKYCSSSSAVSKAGPEGFECAPIMTAGECKVFQMTNVVRRQCGLPPFIASSKCVEAARDHTQEMADRKYFDHVSPSGVAPSARMKKRGINASLYAENIAWDPNRDSIEIISGWMDSKGHRENILDPQITHLGVGAATGRFRGSSGIFWNQCFHAGTGGQELASGPPLRSSSLGRGPTHDGNSLLPILAVGGILGVGVWALTSASDSSPAGPATLPKAQPSASPHGVSGIK